MYVMLLLGTIVERLRAFGAVLSEYSARAAWCR